MVKVYTLERCLAIYKKFLISTKKKFDKTIEELSEAQLLDETFVERVKVFLDTFSPNRLNFRLAPFDLFPEFQILSNLKSEYLVNGDFENVILPLRDGIHLVRKK